MSTRRNPPRRARPDNLRRFYASSGASTSEDDVQIVEEYWTIRCIEAVRIVYVIDNPMPTDVQVRVHWESNQRSLGRTWEPIENILEDAPEAISDFRRDRTATVEAERQSVRKR